MPTRDDTVAIVNAKYSGISGKSSRCMTAAIGNAGVNPEEVVSINVVLFGFVLIIGLYIFLGNRASNMEKDLEKVIV